MKKKKLAIFDLTDCQGCETEFLAFRDNKDFLFISDHFEIVNWRFATNKQLSGPFDVSLVEGSPTTKREITELKIIREHSKILVALGSCAGTGGIPAIIEEKKRKKLIQYVYGKKYQPKSINAKPINHYIKVDYSLPGCPANPYEIREFLANIVKNKITKEKKYSVCMECKAKNNICLLTEGQACLGPLTKAGCGAICPSNGTRCYGCYGMLENANFQALVTAFKKQGKHKKEIKKILDIFWEESKEYQKYFNK